MYFRMNVYVYVCIDKLLLSPILGRNMARSGHTEYDENFSYKYFVSFLSPPAQVELPFIASNGFPGRLNEGVISNLVSEFVPRESPDYIYIRVHQFDLLSISVEDFFKNVSTNIKKGSDNYWISVGSNSLQIQLDDTKIGPNGLLLEFGGEVEKWYLFRLSVVNIISLTNETKIK